MTTNPLPPTNEFHISFNTQVSPGYIRTVKVTIQEDVLVDMDEQVRVDLADHPLYKVLQKYVHSNPR